MNNPVTQIASITTPLIIIALIIGGFFFVWNDHSTYSKTGSSVQPSDVQEALQDVKNNNGAEALAILNRLIVTSDKNISVHNLSYLYGLRADAKQETGDITGAIADLNQAIMLDPVAAKTPYADLAELYAREGKTSEARDAYEKAILSDPDNKLLPNNQDLLAQKDSLSKKTGSYK